MERNDAGLARASLPDELLQIVRDHNSSNAIYLQSLTKAALDARYTYTLLAHCGDLFAHICASIRANSSLATSIATLGRVLPHASFLAPFATGLLERERHQLGQSKDEDLLYLLGLFRLLRFDHRIFRKFIQADELATLLGNSSRPVTYLTLRILQIHLSAADHWFESAVRRYLGADSDQGSEIDGLWDEKVIDYRFLSLWEEDRFDAVTKLIKEARNANDASGPTRTIQPNDFHPSTSLVGSVLLPRSGPQPSTNADNLVATKTVSRNMESIAQALKSTDPLLLTGLPGAGKTMLIQSAARSLGKLDKMVTLHLNEQSDAKLLLGIYTTGDTPGSFVWRAGVLTTAVQEGRWVLIEDLDRAPNEVLGTLLPLIERRELQLSNRKDVIHAAEGFRILATVRSTVNHRGEESKPLTHMLGFRHWQTVPITMPSSEEHGLIAKNLYPNLEPFLPQFMTLYQRLMTTRQQSAGQSKTGVARPISPRDLLKWCQRVSLLLNNRTTFTAGDFDSIYLEAIDCFVGALPDDATRASLSAAMAEELRIDPQRRDYLLSGHEVKYEADKTKITIGRYSLAKSKSRQGKTQAGSFSTNPHTSRMLERVTAAVLNREPLLLVGETGVGKTTAVQHLATHLGKKLVPFNLSQQSEAGDLLGGFKPVNARTLMVPLKDEFDDLFAQSFSATKNLGFTQSLGKAMAKGKWKTVCQLFNGALGMVDQQRASSPSSPSGRDGEAPSKKRKVDSKYVVDFARWDEFAAQVKVLERKLGSGSDAIAFTFVEGNIVKAVRNGDWVLLDEINLASSDTLEAIADLLDPTPSLLLTEAGNIERINANPDFRVFAAMNPATDVGKKDLPPGIRSRFTELYVESPDKDLKSLQSIVRAYLRQESLADAAISVDVSKLYMEILDLARQNKLVDGAGQRPHFSLRTLTRTLSFAKNIQQTCSLRRALYEGFQMSFLTFLDIESARLIQPLIEKALFKKTNVKSELKKSLGQPNDEHTYVKGYPQSNEYPESKHWIRQGSAEIQDQPEYIITSFVRSNLENLVRAASTRQFPVLIQGPTSSGKTSMIEYLAKRTGHKFTRINNHEHTDLQEYLGTYVSDSSGRLAFQEGVLVKALREGHWIVLDELNLAPTDVLEALNRLLDDNRELLIPETQEVIRPHSDFMLFATQNPAGLYGGRKTLSRAFRNRFLELHFDDIPVDELQTILHRRTQLPESRARRIVAVYKELSILRQENRLFEQKSFATLRDLFRWAGRPNDTIEQLAANGYMLLCERVRKPEERVALKAVIERVMSDKGPKVRIDEDSLYAEDCPEITQHKQQTAAAHGVVWTKAMRRLYVLVSRAIANNEPVLLVGETGCGKTTVCQMLAAALGKELHTVNAHQNTETGDLIGSQRPVRNRAGIEARLREQLLASPLLAIEQEESTDGLLAAYDQATAALTKEQKQLHAQSHSHVEIQESRTRFKALFEWADGSLVQAMRNGAFFLLDEISLADDSVLERINSVLESARTILLAEKGSLDSSITAAPGFQFFATMNPGGDYGKRELSPALRNRFTEVWVPSLSDTEDILQIVQTKLSQDAAHTYAGAMVEFASWFKARFDTSASASVSIRDTLAWVEFVNAFQSADLEAAVVHGAAMVYIDTLGANPAGLMSLTSNNIEEEREACLQQLGKLVGGRDAHAIYGQVFSVSTSDSAFGIGPFTVPRVQGSVPTDQGFTFEPPTTRSNAMRVLRALQLIKPVMLEGSPGVGKTALVTAISGAVGMPLTRINLSDQTDLLDLFGSDAPVEGAATGTFVWRDAPFLRAMKAGEWVLLDEMNLASQSVLEGLNACLDHRGEVFVPELGQSFPRHPSFRLFAAQNPHHQGGGRKGLPASFVNRFTVVYADSFKAEDLMMICSRMFPSLEQPYLQQAVEFVSRLQHEVADKRSFGASGGPWEFNLRDTARWLGLAASKACLLPAGTPHDFVESLFTQRFRTAHDRACVTELFSSVFSDAAPVSDLFTNISSQTLQVGIGLLPRDPLVSAPRLSGGNITSSHLRALQTLMLCVHKAWPVVLTGAPGTGKSTLVGRLAASVGADVVTLAMSAETDALDLIGGYEQYDPHRLSAQALSELHARGNYLAKLALVENSSSTAADLLRAFQRVALEPGNDTNLSDLAQLLPSSLQSEILPLLEALRGNAQVIDKARFEWVDGPLIDALQQGKWLVLDNANLCSPSVLDRLNSLLEPNGTLIINEHSTSDGQARVIRPHPAFRIFLTVDPRMGELSRAMRNRAVEVHLHSPAADMSVSSTDGMYTESALARFRALRTVDADHDDYALRVAADHLAVNDQHLIPRFQRELESGLFQGRLIHAGLMPQLDLTSSMTLHKESSSRLQAPADYACVQVSSHHPTRDSVSVHVANGKPFLPQTFHPLNNQPLVAQSQQHSSQALILGAQFDQAISLNQIGKAVSTAKANRKLTDRLKRFMRSAREEAGDKGKSELMDILERMLLPLWQWTTQTEVEVSSLPHARKAMNDLLSVCWVLLRSLESDSLDRALLATCVLVAQSICTRSSMIAPAFSKTLDGFHRALSDLRLTSNGENGRACVSLWKTLRPSMPTTMESLDAILKFESVVDHFDQAVSFRFPVSHIVDLRLAFQRSLDISNTAGVNLDALAEQALASIPQQTPGDEGELVISLKPHFASTFEQLCQHFAILSLPSPMLDPTESTTLEVLAQRKTVDGFNRHLGHASTARGQLRILGLSSQSAVDAESADASVSIELLRSIAKVDQVSLHSLDLLESETKALGRTFASKAHLVLSNQLPALDVCLRSLVCTVLRDLSDSSLEKNASQLLEILEGRSQSATVASQLLPVVEYLQSRLAESTGTQGTQQAAHAWQTFAVSCFELYIPDHAFDPVQEAQIQTAVYEHAKDDVLSRLAALRRFKEAWVGERDSLRARILEEDVAALGTGPAVVEICRPPISQIAQLHTEFQALVRIVKPIRKGQQLDENAWSNLRVIRTRLLERYRAYADLAMPVVGFIDCLFVSQRLAWQAGKDRSNENMNSLASITPLMKAGLQDWLSDDRFIEVQEACRSKDEQLYWLSVMAVRSNVKPTATVSTELRVAVDSAFRAFYEAWRTELSRDQKLDAANSSLYRYRGGDDDEEETTAEELNELFPGYDGEGQQSKPSAITGAQGLAPRMAELYHAVHQPDNTLEKEQLTHLLRQAARTPSTASEAKTPAILCAIHGLTTSFSTATASRTANIYLESNIGQCKALVRLVEKVQARFETIHNAWPEHASPIEVLRESQNVLMLSHAEPLASFLPPVEKLHAAIAEWQKFASSEFSAAGLLEDITNTVVGWRQLELSTWAGLFEHEDRQCRKSAASWWYIAYETIIRASDEISRSTESLAKFAQDLVETLGGFLANCGLGEYSIRLRMLGDFEADLATRLVDQPMLSTVREALSSLISFYGHFEQAVTEKLAIRRVALEKEVKEVIQLASWKDRNIDKLRTSAKSSHKKLFRTVRKYRRLLSEPVASLLQADFPKSATGDIEHRMPILQTEVKASLPNSSKSWTSRPAALLDVPATVREIEASVQGKTSTAVKKINKFLTELDEESNELRKATPTEATEKNKSVVQHLKTQKRRLLADVLRDVRVMGFQTNIADDVLALQQSLHVVLARAPPLAFLSGDIAGAGIADRDFHRLLHIMPSVRESTVKHSEDLTPAEIARAKILLESMLQVSIGQHTALNDQLKDLAALKTSLAELAAFSSSEGVAIRNIDTVDMFKIKTSSVCSVLQACMQCIKVQAELSGTQYPEVMEHLTRWDTDLSAVHSDLLLQASLPQKIDNTALRILETAYTTIVQQLSTQLIGLSQPHPELGPILSQVSLWTSNVALGSNEETNEPSMTADAWTRHLIDIVDRAQGFVTQKKLNSTVSNGQTRKQWFLEQQQALLAASESTSTGAVSKDLRSLLANLHNLSDAADLSEIALMAHTLQPVLQAYANVAEKLVSDMCTLHATTSKMAHRLAISFIQLARQGFCTPSDKPQSDEQQAGQVESGTGLGDGDGAEDISKDIKDDEDLSELAQDAKKEKDDGEELQDEKDAVDMADEDLQGEFGEENGSEGEEDDQDGQSDADVDEEAGHVDDKDDDAVDEKTWDDGKAEENAEKEADKGKGTRNEDIAAAENVEAGAEEGDDEGPEDGQEEDAGAEDEPDVEHNQPEAADPHMENEQNLDLPEDINMDGDKDMPSDISDGGSDFGDDLDDVDANDKDTGKDDENVDAEMGDEEEDGAEQEDTGDSTAAEENQPEEQPDDDDAGSDVAMLDRPEEKDETKQDDGLVSADAGQGNEDDESAQKQGTLSAAEQLENEMDTQQQPSDQSGAADGSNQSQQDASSGKAEPGQEQQILPFKQLGDVLKQWYDQHKNIEAAQEPEPAGVDPDAKDKMDVDIKDARFEHLPENTESDMQALGAAAMDQSKALDEENAMPIEETEPEHEPAPPTEQEDAPQSPTDEPKDSEDNSGAAPNDNSAEPGPKPEKAVVGKPTEVDMDLEMDEPVEDRNDEIEDVDEQLTNTHLSQDDQGLITIEEARQAWSEHESRTRNMAIVLTEHLRLILQPTKATKMRGDFRTGKRLNIKKIIPYIASSYKRDKIWMRRSIPSKRSYQIMLAIDNSQSMNENERKGLAFDTLALVAKSMSMLEVGELCIVGFGETVNINHDFDMPFTTDAGAEVYRQFSFTQSRTDVEKLLQKSIELFRTARLKSTGSASNLWQLQLIISDGLCEDHPSVRQLVRQAHEEQIMVVFIVVDSTAEESSIGTKQSIIDLPVARFDKDANGETQVHMGKYLDTFPFRYYLIVRDVLELPSVLAGALRQWFAEVVETGG